MALSYFEGRELSGSRIVLLVSDGAAVIDPQSEARLRRWFRQNRIRLYWIFLRTAGSHGLFERPADPAEDNPQSAPERYLHLFFTGLDIPYRAYEAENPDALQAAMKDISQLENQTFRYLEQIPRRDLQVFCYLAAALFIGTLLAAKTLEVPSCREA